MFPYFFLWPAPFCGSFLVPEHTRAPALRQGLSVSRNSTRCKRGNSRPRLRIASPTASISPFGNPFDKILRQIAHSVLCPSHTICRKISRYVSVSSAYVRRYGRILTFSTVWGTDMSVPFYACSGRKLPGRDMSRPLRSARKQHAFPYTADLGSTPSSVSAYALPAPPSRGGEALKLPQSPSQACPPANNTNAKCSGLCMAIYLF